MSRRWSEERDHGFDGALELEEGGVLGGVERVGCGDVRGEAEGELWGFVDVGDVVAVGGDGCR